MYNELELLALILAPNVTHLLKIKRNYQILIFYYKFTSQRKLKWYYAYTFICQINQGLTPRQSISLQHTQFDDCIHSSTPWWWNCNHPHQVLWYRNIQRLAWIHSIIKVIGLYERMATEIRSLIYNFRILLQGTAPTRFVSQARNTWTQTTAHIFA